MRLVTIGGYGFDETGFFETLGRAGVDTFVDVRQRRGVRGSRYAFLNSARLQRRLREMGIRYVHLRELAPSTSIRDLQREDDSDEGTAKRDRAQLSPRFVHAYNERVLGSFDVQTFRAAVDGGAKVIAFFCVEQHPAACHRSLVADHISTELGLEVEHL